MTKQVPVIRLQSLDEVKSNIDNILSEFIDKGILVVKGSSFSERDQIEIAQIIGDSLGWNINSKSDPEVVSKSIYSGGHSDFSDKKYDHTDDDYVLDWHIEQVYYVDPVLAGLWNMTTFTSSPNSGTTRFVDSIELFSNFSETDKNFLLKSAVVWDKPVNGGSGPFYTKVIGYHPISKKPLLRVETDRGCYLLPKLCAFDGKEPSQVEIERFDSLISELKQQLDSNTEIRYVQHWEQGDLLIVDLFRMYHAVMGGFKFGERKFTGIGIRPDGYTYELYDSMEKLK